MALVYNPSQVPMTINYSVYDGEMRDIRTVAASVDSTIPTEIVVAEGLVGKIDNIICDDKTYTFTPAVTLTDSQVIAYWIYQARIHISNEYVSYGVETP